MKNDISKPGFRSWFILPLLALLCVAVAAQAGGFHGKRGMHSPFERMLQHLDHLDLNEAQEQEVKAIVKKHQDQAQTNKKMELMKTMLELSPNDPDYLQQMTEHADQAAAEMRSMIVTMAQVRMEIYEVLTLEQEQEIERAIAKKIKRMHRYSETN